MTASMPQTPEPDQDDASNEGVSSPTPVEGGADAPAGDEGSPDA